MTDQPEAQNLVSFDWDLHAHETARLAAVLDAMPDWDPGQILADERAAHRMLYSDLDPQQQEYYRLLVREGVLDA